MGRTREAIISHLRPLVGLRLSLARRAADLRNFQFGPVRTYKGGTVGEYALHLQCPWRIETGDGIVTGRNDLWEPTAADAAVDWDQWDYEAGDNLQDTRIATLLVSHDSVTKSAANHGDTLVVETIDADDCGGVTIVLSGGYRLLLFPDGTRGEDWRLFRAGRDEPHFVIAGGKIEDEIDDGAAQRLAPDEGVRSRQTRSRG